MEFRYQLIYCFVSCLVYCEVIEVINAQLISDVRVSGKLPNVCFVSNLFLVQFHICR